MASEKAKFYEQYKEAKEELLKLKTAKQNPSSLIFLYTSQISLRVTVQNQICIAQRVVIDEVV